MDILVISALLLKIIHLVSGLILCFIGRDLVLKGITIKFSGEGELRGNKLRVITTSPGIIFLLAGLTIVVLSVSKESEFLRKDLNSIEYGRFLSGVKTGDANDDYLSTLPASARSFVSMVRIYANVTGDSISDKKSYDVLLKNLDGAIKANNIEATYIALQEIVEKRPSVFLEIVSQPGYQWILGNEQTIERLTKHVERLVWK